MQTKWERRDFTMAQSETKGDGYNQSPRGKLRRGKNKPCPACACDKAGTVPPLGAPTGQRNPPLSRPSHQTSPKLSRPQATGYRCDEEEACVSETLPMGQRTTRCTQVHAVSKQRQPARPPG